VAGARLSIAISGPYLDAVNKYLIDPFYTTKPDGAGLGLSINYSIVRQHGGTISAENLEDDRGVTFIIMLPGAHLAKDQEAVT
jgi:signal transduction histidine kinase